MLQTDYIDISSHSIIPAFCPKPGDGTGLYERLWKRKSRERSVIIGITNHRIAVAKEAIESGLYETLQFPFSYLAAPADLEIVEMCKKADMGIYCHEGSFRRTDPQFRLCLCLHGSASVCPCSSDLGNPERVRAG